MVHYDLVVYSMVNCIIRQYINIIIRCMIYLVTMATCDMEWISENEMLSTERNVSVHVMRSTCTV